MTPELKSNIHDVKARELFAAAADTPPDQRGAYLNTACGDNPELREHVEALLEAHDRAGEFLAGATVTDATGTGALPFETPSPSEVAGTRIGPYTIVEYLGEGGFGAVYRARQDHPVRRTVALKIIKPGMDSRQVIARFEAERQALAMMDHPNIARVFDAGATDAGRPFFVMELVEGVPITQYCDQAQLSTRQRLDLFMQVCRAVQHAHTKGIIHRDIKPSNILVTQSDAQLIPKVIDFGIAKATSQRLTDRTLFTDARQMVGTPEYMSPEQADGSGIDVDTRTDVYSLGVLLYELLTGTTPFDAKDLRSKAFGEMQRIIREVDPPLPSNRLSTLGETLTTVAASRSTEPRRLTHTIRGELDWIVMKALEKERARRYETASDLASDVERYLRDELVQARPPSRAYLFRKMMRRHRVLIGAGAAIAAAILIGMGLALWGLQRARHERDNAVESKTAESRQLAIANAARAKAREVNQMMRELYVASNRRRTGDEHGFPHVLSAYAAKLENGILADQPDLEAALRTTLGNIYTNYGMYKDSEYQLQRALDLRQELYGAQGHTDLADSLSDLGWLVHSKRQHERAELLIREALDMRRKLLGDNHTVVAATYHSLGMVLRAQKREGEAIAAFRKSLALRIAHQDQVIAADPSAAQQWGHRAHLHGRSGDFEEAIKDYSRAIELEPNNHWWWYHRIALRLYVGDTDGYRADCREIYNRFSKSPYPEVAERSVKGSLLVPDPPIDLAAAGQLLDRAVNANAPLFIGWIRICKGVHDYRSGRYEQALSWLQRGRDSNIHVLGMALADYYAAMSLYKLGQPERARHFLKRAIRLSPTDAFALTDRDPIEGGSVVHGWLVCQITRREAEALIPPGPATNRPTTKGTAHSLPPDQDDLPDSNAADSPGVPPSENR